MKFPIRGETEGVGDKRLYFGARLPLGVPHHQDVVSPLAGRDSRISRGRPGDRLGVSCLHAVDSLLNLLLPDVDQLQGRRYYEAKVTRYIYTTSDQIWLYSNRPDTVIQQSTRYGYTAIDQIRLYSKRPDMVIQQSTRYGYIARDQICLYVYIASDQIRLYVYIASDQKHSHNKATCFYRLYCYYSDHNILLCKRPGD